MTPDKFVDEYLLLGKQHRCPLIPFRARCQATGLTTRKVLAEIRSRYGNGSSNPLDGVPSPWMPECRMKMSDGSRPRAFEGFAFKDMFAPLPPFVTYIWPHLPFKGKVCDFPVPVTAPQLAGACKCGRVVMLREGSVIHIVRDVDSEFYSLLKKAKHNRYERQKRVVKRREWHQKKKPMSSFVAKIWPYLPYKGPANKFPLPSSVHQLAGACKSGLVAMIRRGNDIHIVRYIDGDYEDVLALGKDRRAWDGPFYKNWKFLGDSPPCIEREDRDYLWDEYLKEFPHPTPLHSAFASPSCTSVLTHGLDVAVCT